MPRLSSDRINNDRKSPITWIRRDGHEWGKKEAQIAIHTLGGSFTRNAAMEWINHAIDKRTDYLRASGVSPSDIKLWASACRIMFMLKINYAML